MILKLIKYGYTYMIKDRNLNEFQNHIACVTDETLVDIQSLVLKTVQPFFNIIIIIPVKLNLGSSFTCFGSKFS